MAGIIATDSSTEIEIASGDEIYVPEDVVIAVNSGRGIDSDVGSTNDRRVVVDGAVVSTASNAILLRNDADGVGLNFLLIGREGVVRTLNYESNSAVWVFGSDSLIDNAGEISGRYGVFVEAYDGSAIVNSGIMSGAAQDVDDAGITMFVSSDVRIENTGLVTGGAGIVGESSDFFLRNSGEIVGFLGAGVDATQRTPSGAITIVNTGLVSGATAAVVAAGFDDVVRNGGVMDGNVLLGEGLDVYRGLGDGVVHGLVKGGDGSDDLRGASGEDMFEGEGGADLLRGKGGDDFLYGGAEDDLLFGGRGDDLLVGGDDADALRGGRDDDELVGGGGADDLFGGRGDDEMTGGGGADRFVILRRGDEDAVTDFQNNIDKLDLSAFGFTKFQQVRKLAERADGGVLIDLEAVGGGALHLEGFGFGKFNGADVIL